jgi:hypothetical protein
MPPDPGVMFFLFLVGMIMLAAVAYMVLLVARWNSNRIHYVTPRVRSRALASVERYVSIGSEPEEPEEPAIERRTEEFVLNLDEQAAVAKMIYHKATAEKPTKASIIWAGWAIKKGASQKYQRASEIYDALFVIPPSVVLYPDPENGGRVPASYPVSGRR